MIRSRKTRHFTCKIVSGRLQFSISSSMYTYVLFRILLHTVHPSFVSGSTITTIFSSLSLSVHTVYTCLRLVQMLSGKNPLLLQVNWVSKQRSRRRSEQGCLVQPLPHSKLFYKRSLLCK